MENGIKVNFKRARRVLWMAVCAGGAILAGCSPDTTLTSETDERAYRRGESLLREGRREEALQAFLSVISTRPDAVESHLEAGLIYLNHIKDPLAAIYHFRNYLVFAPEGEHATFVRELILTAQKDFAQSLPGNPFGDAVERVNLMESVKALQEENTRLKETIAGLRRDLQEQESEILRYRDSLSQSRQAVRDPSEVAPIVIQAAPERSPETESATVTTYTVESGDTLSRISSNVYGTPARWMEIFQANRDQLPSPNALKPGQELRIP